MKTAIMPHGMHVKAFAWEENIWGIPPWRLGRAPMALLLAVEHDADLIIFGTGASKRDDKFEAECILDLLRERLPAIHDFEQFADYDINFLREKLEKSAVVEIRSINTVTELEFGFERCVQAGIERVVLTISPGQLPRCMRDSDIVRAAHPEFGHLRISGEASHVNFFEEQDGQIVEAPVSATCIFEPPHRGDDPLTQVPWQLRPNRLFQRFFKVPDKQKCLEDINQVFHRRGA